MIANRFNPLGVKKMTPAMRYSQDGLIAHWDALENIGYGKHDANATVWKDLAGNTNATLEDGAFIGNKFFVATDKGRAVVGARIDETAWNNIFATRKPYTIEVYCKGSQNNTSWVQESIISSSLVRLYKNARNRFTLNVLVYDGVCTSSSLDNTPLTSFVSIPFWATGSWDDRYTSADNIILNGVHIARPSTSTPAVANALGASPFIGVIPTATNIGGMSIARIAIYEGINTQRSIDNYAIDLERFGEL